MTETSRKRLLTGDAEGLRCVLCDRVWPKDVIPLWHHWVVSATALRADCHCAGTHKEPTWHAFEVVNSYGCLVADGLVCPKCIATRGWGAAVNAALDRMRCADLNAN